MGQPGPGAKNTARKANASASTSLSQHTKTTQPKATLPNILPSRGKKRKHDQTNPDPKVGAPEKKPRRSTRIQKKQEAVTQRKIRELQRSNVSQPHFGDDMTTGVRESTTTNHLPEQTKEKASKALSNPIALKRVPKHLQEALNATRKSGGPAQIDRRINPEKGGKYEGYMVTATPVSTSSFAPQDKEMTTPSSPKPNDSGNAPHRAHTSAYAVGGPLTNGLKTVWGPPSANTGLDSRVERTAKSQAEESGNPTYTLSVTTHNRRSYGILSTNKSGQTTLSGIQYQRRGFAKKDE